MDLGLFRFLCQAETRRLVSLLGVTITILLVLQFSELPNSEFFSSLTAKIKSFTMDTPLVNSTIETHNGNVNLYASNSSSISPQTSSLDEVASLEKGKRVETVDVFRNHSSQENQSSLLAPQPMVPLSNTSFFDSKVYPKDGILSSLQRSNATTVKDASAIWKNSKRRPSKVVSISEMNLILQHNHDSSQGAKPASSSAVNAEILNAKSEIENAPIVMNDSRLYSPLYRNVSMFKRSYELMEKMLKVFIYQDGDKPIFHEPLLEGIYASEGWFMKSMEGNKQFTTRDPEKAHLFYIPFSSRLLQLTLYAPAETRGRMLNCIRALCNADTEVGFEIGKDVSLPETYVRSDENPLKNIGGNPPSQRPILAFFAGGLHGYVRPMLLNLWENKEPDMKISGPLPHVRGNKNYIELMKSSRFCICARGHEVNSPRVVEAIFHECVPVIISDNFIPPLFEVLNWESFAVFIKEKHIAYLRDVLVSISEERYLEMHKRVKMVQEHFLWHHEPVKYDLFHMLLHSIWYNRVFYTS
ncbi:unnamed protein product [Vicia faba]|uniref:Exostosin GT47 domain-containing protein n=1 Tax=Vicia faba TaxID=3906 RepID=A0AAV0ZMP8_VICFA|nr:unnamed protein product [Vicia faba]